MKGLACGVDLGGTKLAVGLVGLDGTLVDKIVVYDHCINKDEHGTVREISELIRELLKKNGVEEWELSGIGVGFPGHIRSPEGITIVSSNIRGFRNFPLKRELESYFNLRIVTDNDANAQAFGEFKYGAGVGYDSMVFITVSSGVGAGIIINGKLYRGITGTAGEFGHMIVDPDGEIRCGCGNYGCLMTYTCGAALGKIFKRYLVAGMTTKLELDENVPAGSIDGQVLKKGLEIGDALTKKVVDQCARYMGIGLYNLFQILNPPLFVLGGGLMNLGNYFFEQIKHHFYTLANGMMYDEVGIVPSKLKEDAGVIGAASLLLEGQ
jgi:glucokinase